MENHWKTNKNKWKPFIKFICYHWFSMISRFGTPGLSFTPNFPRGSYQPFISPKLPPEKFPALHLHQTTPGEVPGPSFTPKLPPGEDPGPSFSRLPPGKFPALHLRETPPGKVPGPSFTPNSAQGSSGPFVYPKLLLGKFPALHFAEIIETQWKHKKTIGFSMILATFHWFS